jgi:hypothetical protein
MVSAVTTVKFERFLDIKNERAYLIGGGPGKLKNMYKKNLGRESMRWHALF